MILFDETVGVGVGVGGVGCGCGVCGCVGVGVEGGGRQAKVQKFELNSPIRACR